MNFLHRIFVFIMTFTTCGVLAPSALAWGEGEDSRDSRDERDSRGGRDDRDTSVSRDAEDNPPPPRKDPELRRTRAVGLPGRSAPRAEKTGLPYRGLREAVSETQGFGTVRKPDAREFVTTAFPPRILYLNGANVSSLRGETLENVQVRIDEEGNVHIQAPHYEVSTDTSFHPLLPTELPRLPKGRVEPFELPTAPISKQGNKEKARVEPRDEPRADARAEPRSEARTEARGPSTTPKVEVLEDTNNSVPVLEVPSFEEKPEGKPRTLRISGDEGGDPSAAPAASGMKAVPAR